VQGRSVCLILGDSDVDRDERFLEYVSQLLATGEVAGMIPREELDAMLEAVRPIFRKEKPGAADTRDALRAFLGERARAGLHVALCLSPAGGKFARRAQQFPGIVAGTAVDWFLPWPREALVSGKS
jgi:dynein heavy chain